MNNEEFGISYLFLLGVLANVCQVMNFYKIDGLVDNNYLSSQLEQQNQIYLKEILDRLSKIEVILNEEVLGNKTNKQ